MAFPQDVLSTKVELWYDEQWNEITSDVRGTGAEDGEISIDPRGQPDETSSLSVTQAELSVNNRNGKYSPRNFVSPLYGKIGMNTPIRIISDIGDTTNVEDDFSTNGTNGWPNADSGHVWTRSGGAAADYLVNGGLGIHRHAAAGGSLECHLNSLQITDFDCVVEGITVEALPTGEEVEVYLRGRISNGGNDYIQALLRFFPSDSVQLYFEYSISGVVGTYVGPLLQPSGNDPVSLRFRTVGRTIYMRGWETGTTEPDEWDITFTDMPIITPGTMMLGSSLGAGTTNALPFDISFQSVSFNLGIILFTGEISEWPKRWDKSGEDVWVTVQASGLTRRLMQGEKPFHSPLYRHYKRIEGLVGYWSFENLEGASNAYTELVSDLDDGAPLLVNNPNAERVALFKWSDESTLVGSDPLPSATLGASDRDFNFDHAGWGKADFLPTSSANNACSVSWWGRVEMTTDAGSLTMEQACAIEMKNASPVRYYIFTVQYNVVANNPVISISANGYPADLSALLVSATVDVAYSPLWRHFHFSVQPSAGDVLVRIWVDGNLEDIATLAVTSIGQPSRLDTFQLGCIASGNIGNSFGHLAVASGSSVDDLLSELDTTVAIGTTAYAGETDVARIFRLCTEEGINIATSESPDDPLEQSRMGPQRTLTFMELLHECARAGDGVLYEMREDFGYRYKTRWYLYGNESALTLDYANSDLSEVPETTDDDQRLRNKITITREGGSGPVTVEQTDGPLSTNDPRAAIPGAGVYETEYKVNLYADSQQADYGGWRKHLGTWDESRFPGVAVALHRTPFTGNMAKYAAAALLDIAEILTIVNPPEWLPPDSIVLQVRSVKIFLSNFNWGIEWSCLPGRPWTEVATASAAYGRADTADSRLASAVDDNDTDLLVFTEETNLPWSDPQWTEDLGELNILGAQGIDFRLNPQTVKGGLGGERVRATVNTIISDTFTRSGQLSGSQANTGQTWVNTTGTAANATTDGTKAVLVHTAANTELRQTLPGSTPDMCIQCDVSFSIASATGAQFYASLVFRQTDANNYYTVLYELSPGSPALATIYIIRVVAGVGTNLSVKPVSHASASTVYRTKVVINNGDVLVKIWDPATETEGVWTTECREGARALLTGNDIALRSIRATGNTNTNPAVHFDNLTVHTGKITPPTYDRFARTTANGLGNADAGGAWTTTGSGGTVQASDYNVAPNRAAVLLPVANSNRGGTLPSVSYQDVCVGLNWTCPLATGDVILAGVVTLRRTASFYVYGYVNVNTNNTLSMVLGNTTEGGLANTTVFGATHTAATVWRNKVAIVGQTMMMKVWDSTKPEPEYWQLRATTAIAAATGYVGWFHSRTAGNTNVNPTPTVADFRVENPQKIVVQRGMDGASRAWDAGTDIRLWTPARVGR